MSQTFALVRADQGQPLMRVVIGVGPGTMYVVNPALVEEAEMGNTTPIGFPHDDVFQYDEALFGALKSEWNQIGKTNPETWALAEPYSIP